MKDKNSSQEWTTRRKKPTLKIERGREAVVQARLVLLVMINIAQLWILSATIEAALAREFDHLWPLLAASAACWVIALTIFLWWKPTPRLARKRS
ncbi:MAG: DUF6755 family protein [Pyrinomonadaceae bacterium]